MSGSRPAMPPRMEMVAMTGPANASDGVDVVVRPEAPGDEAAIAEVVRLAFGQEEEVVLVDRLRRDGDVTLSLVAADGGRVVGHVLFCPLTIRTEAGPVAALALAPLAVLPSHQRRGIGGRLVRAGLAAAEAARHRIVTVLGHPEYYARFGFTAAAARPLAVPFAGPAWMAMELVPGALEGVRGPVAYPKAFGIES